MGDEVELTVRLVSPYPHGKGWATVAVGGDSNLGYTRRVTLDAGRLRPRPIKVGDRVDCGVLAGRDDEYPGTAIAIHKERVWVEWPDGSSGLWDLSQLVKV